MSERVNLPDDVADEIRDPTKNLAACPESRTAPHRLRL
jgi:hypothetical protein